METVVSLRVKIRRVFGLSLRQRQLQLSRPLKMQKLSNV